jgi:uncharacterized integral membrane protein
MRAVVWLLRAAIFILLFGLAIKNGGSVELRFFLNQSWLAPLSLVLLLAFTAGVVIGLLSVLGVWVRQRRELAKLRAQLEAPRETA